LATSKIPAVIDALVTACTNASTIGGAGVSVYDGPHLTTAPDQNVLWIGLDDPDSQGLANSGDSTQSFPGLGTRQRDELGTVYCVAEAWSGSTDVKGARDNAYNIVLAVENLLRADATIAGTFLVGWGEVDGFQFRQGQADVGAVARVSFHIKYKARI
jgi:hypothetical protein